MDFQVKVDMKIYNFTAAPWVLDKHGLNASEINPVTQKQFTGLKEDANSYKFVKESKWKQRLNVKLFFCLSGVGT